MLRDPQNPKYASVAKFQSLGLGEKSYSSPDMEKAMAEFSKAIYNEKVQAGILYIFSSFLFTNIIRLSHQQYCRKMLETLIVHLYMLD